MSGWEENSSEEMWELWLAGVFRIEGAEGISRCQGGLSENQAVSALQQVLTLSSPVPAVSKAS